VTDLARSAGSVAKWAVVLIFRILVVLLGLGIGAMWVERALSRPSSPVAHLDAHSFPILGLGYAAAFAFAVAFVVAGLPRGLMRSVLSHLNGAAWVAIGLSFLGASFGLAWRENEFYANLEKYGYHTPLINGYTYNQFAERAFDREFVGASDSEHVIVRKIGFVDATGGEVHELISAGYYPVDVVGVEASSDLYPDKKEARLFFFYRSPSGVWNYRATAFNQPRRTGP
jgi:hypothetical protein